MEKLNCKSLMIGDYVNYRGQIIKVTSLYDKGDSNEVGWSDKESVWVNADNVEPIPLTPEILEKNGFTKDLFTDGLHYWFTLIDKHTKFSILYVRSVFKWLGPLDFKYVHELQHALRLCGIKKEIEL